MLYSHWIFYYPPSPRAVGFLLNFSFGIKDFIFLLWHTHWIYINQNKKCLFSINFYHVIRYWLYYCTPSFANIQKLRRNVMTSLSSRICLENISYRTFVLLSSIVLLMSEFLLLWLFEVDHGIANWSKTTSYLCMMFVHSIYDLILS